MNFRTWVPPWKIMFTVPPNILNVVGVVSIRRVCVYIIVRVFCPRVGPSLQTQEPRLYFCRKAGLPPQTLEARLQFYQELNRCDTFPLFSAPNSLFGIWTDLKRSEKILGASTWRRGEWIWPTVLSGLNRNSPQGLNVSSIKVFDQIRESQWTYKWMKH